MNGLHFYTIKGSIFASFVYTFKITSGNIFVGSGKTRWPKCENLKTLIKQRDSKLKRIYLYFRMYFGTRKKVERYSLRHLSRLSC